MHQRFAVSLFSFALVGAAAAQLSDPIPGPINPSYTSVRLVRLDGPELTAPNLLIGAGDGSGRMFVTDQDGQVHIFGSGAPGPFIDVSADLPSLGSFDERGLLGLAFHPGFADPAGAGYRCVYTYHTEPAGSGPADFGPSVSSTINSQSVVTEWRVAAVSDNAADTSTRRELLRIDQPQSNHNAGMLAFDSTGALLIALGDGGGGGDNGSGHTPGTGNGQDPTTVLGSFLRIDPSNSVAGVLSANGAYTIPADNPYVTDPEPGIPSETFATGFRNPFRFSVDAITGDIIAADVGQGDIEEVSIVTPRGNYGWRTKEGSFLYSLQQGGVLLDTNPDPSLIDPVLEYDHDEGIAIIGGFVYRGSRIASLSGRYVFADYRGNGDQPFGRLFAGDLATGDIEEILLGPGDSALPIFVTGMGMDDDGELFIMGTDSVFFGSGDARVYRILPYCLSDITTTGATLPGQPGVGEPDGVSDLDDLGYYLSALWLPGAPGGDLTTTGATLPTQPGFGEPDGAVDLDDLGFYLNDWLSGCS